MRPLVISHAACGGHAPENTLQGIRKAIQLGSDAIEIDVQATSDGVPVLMHDATVDRTTSGNGAVKDHTLEQIRSLDTGGEPVPTLAEVLDITKNNALLVMEIKQPGIEEHVSKVVHDAGALNEVMVWSFFPPALEGMRAVEPRIPAALLVGGDMMPNWPAMRTLAVRLGLQGVSLFVDGVTGEMALDCRRSGLALYSWTADSKDQINKLVGLGADGICSNFPDRVNEVLAAAE
jgi:glycerophosphoryl diester phosphodiesterase